jgi:hypothetical protein
LDYSVEGFAAILSKQIRDFFQQKDFRPIGAELIQQAHDFKKHSAARICKSVLLAGHPVLETTEVADIGEPQIAQGLAGQCGAAAAGAV